MFYSPVALTCFHNFKRPHDGHKAEESRHQTRPFQGNLPSCGRSEVGAAVGGAAEAQAAASEVGAACGGGSAWCLERWVHVGTMCI